MADEHKFETTHLEPVKGGAKVERIGAVQIGHMIVKQYLGDRNVQKLQLMITRVINEAYAQGKADGRANPATTDAKKDE